MNHAEYMRQWRKDNPEKLRTINARHYQKHKAKRLSKQAARKKAHRAWAIEYLGGECVQCGETEELQFDHINPLEKTFKFSNNWSRSKETLAAELDKAQLLCEQCHIEKTRAGQEYNWRLR